ncbi:hypothetical protein KP509_07G032400 [Ceratopteris richardii]|uniref:Auxilin-related protein 2 n=1 Tax=Ceratopteris richardii TaxID=49495 RepID=A0A8T2U8S2_CERRI|nr:hypothetical protein KP509_07G032400 [Ceratopteris richardii]
MAPSKAPLFAVCREASVEEVLVDGGRGRNNDKTTKRSPLKSFAESLYADLLWDCGGVNVENATIATGADTSFKPLPTEEFADVFGGPPKFATLSTQISFLRGPSPVSDACCNDAVLFQLSTCTPVTTSTSSIDIQSRIVQRAPDNPIPSPSSAKSVKTSYMENRGLFLYKDKISMSGDEAALGASSHLRNIDTFVRPRESSRFDTDEDIEDARLSSMSIEDTGSMFTEASIKELPKGLSSGCGGKSALIHQRMAHSLKGFQDAKQMSSHCVQVPKEHMFFHAKQKRKGNMGDNWVTIKDICFQTEPCAFAPPSRPPPRIFTDATYVKYNQKTAMRMGDSRNDSDVFYPKCLVNDSGFLRASHNQTSNLNDTYCSKVTKIATETTKVKAQMILEARAKARSMVERKYRERQRTQQLMERCADSADYETECHMNDKKCVRRIVQQLNSDVTEQVMGQIRQEKVARQYIGKNTRVLQSKDATKYLESTTAGQHNFSGQPVESKQESTVKIDMFQTSIHDESTGGIMKSDTNGINTKLSSSESGHEKGIESVVVPSKEQQQADAAGESHGSRVVGLDNHDHIAERMAKALEEKKQHDVECLKEQIEKEMAAKMLDEDIKVWAAGKQGNLKALLCSLHLVLWPECGWRRVSAEDILTAETLRKSYRRAALCVHPDKVQQRGATLAQKYVAEKVFDLLREASARYF